jgi:peroxiredoxin
MNLGKIFNFTKKQKRKSTRGKKKKSKKTKNKSKSNKSNLQNNNNNNNKKCNKLSLNNAVGFSAPKVQLKIRVRDNNVEGDNKFRWDKMNTKDIYEGKRIIIFALPGAYTPTCHNTHLPGYEKNYHKIKKMGIDEIYCLSVNDAFVMFNWCKKLKAKNVKPIPDGNGKFTKAMGALVKKSNLGFGDRSWRYSMVVNNGRIEKMFCEKGKRNNCSEDPFEVSDADTMMKYLESKNK